MWKQYLRGNVHFEVVDCDVKMLNRLRGFCLGNICQHEEITSFDIPRKASRAVKRLLGKRDYTAQENTNIYSLGNFLKNRVALMITAVICLLAFIVLDQFTFRVRISGLSGDEYAAVSAYLRDNGVKSFAPKSARNAKTVTQRAVENFPFVAAGNARIVGSNLVFSFYRAESPVIQTGDVVATCDGVISGIIVYGGMALVTVGDVVRTGDVLVTGVRPMAVIHISNGTEVICTINNAVIESN